jgi:hypothetical protein
VAPGADELYYSGHVTTTTTGQVSIPANGATIYARIFSYINGAYQFRDYTYRESGTP